MDNHQRLAATREQTPRRRPRRASVLLVVLVVIVLLALGAYTFSETMISEYQAVTMHGRKVESRVLADSGVQYVAAMLQQRFDFAGEGVFDNPSQLQDVLLTESDVARGRGRFSVAAPRGSGGSAQAIRFGLTDESSKLNLNALAQRVLADHLKEEEARAILMQLPGMTDETADATLSARATTAWLLIEGHVEVAKMRQLDRYITARGDVYSGQIIGYFDAGETLTRLEVVIDATHEVPRVVSLQDLTDLGPGVTRSQLKASGS